MLEVDRRGIGWPYDIERAHMEVMNGNVVSGEDTPIDRENGLLGEDLSVRCEAADGNYMELCASIAIRLTDLHPTPEQQEEFTQLQVDEVIEGAMRNLNETVSDNPVDTMELLEQLEERHAELVSFLIGQAMAGVERDETVPALDTGSSYEIHEALAVVIEQPETEEGPADVAKAIQQAVVAESEIPLVDDRELAAA